MTPDAPKPVVLLILDGWGHRDDLKYNAIAAAHTPFWDELWATRPHTLIEASGTAVGLPAGQMGNSEVGHLNLGAGRVVYQEFTRINRAIENGEFFTNPVLTDAVDLAKVTHRAVHIMGLLSPGGVHSHEDQIHAMVELAVRRGAERVYLHAFLDGRDTPPKSALDSVRRMEEKFRALGRGRFASVIGRYYAMDRDHRWPRIQAAYDLISQGKAAFTAPSAIEAVEQAYARGETDEFVPATAVLGPDGDVAHVADGDVLIMMNFRSDRARQITRPFIEPDFDGFERAVVRKLGRFVSLTEYQSEFNIPVAFPPERLANVLGSYLADLGRRQLRVAETEKYAHVTFFFNGGVETANPGEDRILVPSPTDVPTYNLKPEMSAPQVTEEVLKAVAGGRYDLIICNFANPDMVGHTGDFDATVKAIGVLDGCLARIVPAVQEAGGEVVITADHGNAELMFDPQTGQRHTAHTSNPVPVIYCGRRAHLRGGGALRDIAPTLLTLMGLPLPEEMTGHSLVEGVAAAPRKAAG